jgi:inner membrane protein
MSPALLQSPLARIALLGALVLALQIPAIMIGELGHAREASRDEATAEIARHWGGAQELLGPFLAVPYTYKTRDNQGHETVHGSWIVVAPERLEIDGTTTVESRSRGLFKVPVYRAETRWRGHFRAPAADVAPAESGASINWGAAELVLRVSDPHALDEVQPPSLQGRAYAFEPGGGPLASSGLHTRLTGLRPDQAAPFELRLAFRGSSALRVAPGGRETAVRLRSNWPDPAFQGAWLPLQREVGPQGFTASWNVPYVARGLPAVWEQGQVGDEQLRTVLFGADFLAPVDPYRMSERSLKYWPLFVGLVFVLVWLFEAVGGVNVHPMQYLMIGAALCLFYLLELSLAEHLGFATAYALAGAAVTVQVTLYSRSALGGRRSLAMLGTTATLYALLFLLLREDDYALLIGAASLFVVLSAVMYLTRRVRWGAASAEAPRVQ